MLVLEHMYPNINLAYHRGAFWGTVVITVVFVITLTALQWFQYDI